MIRGRMMHGENPMLLLGLSRENVNRLLDDKPILISNEDLAAMGLPTGMEVLLIAGETEATISKQLGGLAIQPEVAGQVFTQRPGKKT